MSRRRSAAIVLFSALWACRAKAPTYRDAAPRPPAGDLRGTFALTYYWVANEPVDDHRADTTLFDRDCTELAKVSASFAADIAQAGTGRLGDGRVLGVQGECECSRSPCMRVLDADQPWGVGANNRPLVPFVSLAVDRSVIPIGTHLYIDEIDGVQLPSYFPGLHDGCVVADDTGGRMKGERVDWFVGRRSYYKDLDGLLHVKQVTIRDGGERCR